MADSIEQESGAEKQTGDESKRAEEGTDTTRVEADATKSDEKNAEEKTMRENDKDSKPENVDTSKAEDNESSSSDVLPSPVCYDVESMVRGVYQDTEVQVDPATVQLLTDGFVTRFLPSLEKAKSSISQIKSSQMVLIETVEQETAKFTDCQAMLDLEHTMNKARLYHNKLLKLRRDMTNLHEKSKKLKLRAVKLQQQKMKEELNRAHDLEKEYEKEKMLTAKVASSEQS